MGIRAPIEVEVELNMEIARSRCRNALTELVQIEGVPGVKPVGEIHPLALQLLLLPAEQQSTE
jgi:hypothetical protein